LELCQLARELNSIFEIQITISTIAYLTHVTRDIRYMFIRITSKDDFMSLTDWININVWLFYYATGIFYLNYVCESISVKVNPHTYIILNIYLPSLPRSQLETFLIFRTLPKIIYLDKKMIEKFLSHFKAQVKALNLCSNFFLRHFVSTLYKIENLYFSTILSYFDVLQFGET